MKEIDRVGLMGSYVAIERKKERGIGKADDMIINIYPIKYDNV